jgi:hypothetical protein
VAVFPGDAGILRVAEREHNVVHWSEFDRGGHFAAMEAPALLVTYIRARSSSGSADLRYLGDLATSDTPPHREAGAPSGH